MNFHEQLRAWRGDVEVGQPPCAHEVLRWASAARPFCAHCVEQPLFEVKGAGLSGRTRSRAIIDNGLRRGMIEEAVEVHCSECPPAEPLVQLGVLDLLLRLPWGQAWCVRYAYAQPGAPTVQPATRGSAVDRYGVTWLPATVDEWLAAHVERWRWGLVQWQKALESAVGANAVSRNGGELVIVPRGKLTRLRWYPGVSAEVDRLYSLDHGIFSQFEAGHLAVGGLLGVDLTCAADSTAQALGTALLDRP